MSGVTIYEDKLTLQVASKDATKQIRREMLRRNLLLRTLRKMHLIDRWISGR